MDALALSPRVSRWQQSPRSLRSRSGAPASPCVDVQWRFLAAAPPPSLSATTTTPVSPGRGSSTLEELSQHPSVRVELEHEHQRLRLEKERRERQEHRVLQDLLGTTQRKALLDKVLHEMEAMALTPVRHEPRNHKASTKDHSQPATLAESRRSSALHSLLKRGSLLTAAIEQSSHSSGRRASESVELLPQRRLSALGNGDSHDDQGPGHGATTAALPAGSDPNDSGDDSSSDCDDLPELRFIRDRHRRLTQSAASDPDAADAERNVSTPRILWQKTTHVKLAMDLPEALLLNQWDDQEEDDESERRAHSTARTPRTPRQRRRTRSHKQDQHDHSTTESPTKLPSPRATHRAAYGSWYVPKDQWWSNHESERQRLATTFPEDVVQPLPRSHDELHCHHSASRNHKDPLPQMPRPAVVVTSPSPGTNSSAVPHHHHGSGGPTRPMSPSTRPIDRSLDPMAARAATLHQEIPQSYIGREYRNYLVSRGARLPTYLS
ncbi:hypothetical protein PINS_up014634 [Pythium insidiosum]|nr:hypothetical protein PINS_up014634 [Pythium insidiosum]